VVLAGGGVRGARGCRVTCAYSFVFFFQAEDGIRDFHVTGVQTCALPISPSGAAYEDLTPESICVIDLDGNPVEDGLEPSSEVPMHTSVYKSTDAKAVVHTHPLYASTLSAVVDELPAGHDMGALLGGRGRRAPCA